jgi:cell division transport system ATP-binding protein
MEGNYLITYREVEIRQGGATVLRNIDLDVAPGEFIYLLGKVGSGKSSFLKSLYGEADIEEGYAYIFGYNLRKIKRKQIPFLRRKTGIIFQDFQLLADRTVFKNLAFVLKATGWNNKQEIKNQVHSVLRQVGMESHTDKFPHQLSGGEQQRVVIARALLNSPELIIADEPTGNLDPETGHNLIQLLYDIHKAGTAVIVATHNLRWVEAFPGRILRCNDEHIKEEETRRKQDGTEAVRKVAALPEVAKESNEEANENESD